MQTYQYLLCIGVGLFAIIALPDWKSSLFIIAAACVTAGFIIALVKHGQ